MTPDQDKLNAAVIRLHQDPAPLTVQSTRLQFYSAVAAIQLASRHPGFNGPTAAWEDGGEVDAAHVVQQLLNQMAELRLHPLCGLCGSTDLRFETGVTKFPNLAEAMHSMKVCEAAQALRQYFAQQPKPN